METGAQIGGWGRGLLLAALLGSPSAAFAEPYRATIAIILDDLGEQKTAGDRAVRLPGAVACAFLPNTQFAAGQARLAHALGKEVLLHLPLQPGATARPYPSAITLDTGRAEMDAYVRDAIESIPHVRGINNHQGSLLTETPIHMDWLMSGIRDHGGLYFVDSRTSGRSIAYRMARARGVPAAERSVFLDDDPAEPAIRAQFSALVARALRDGRALAIGHPYPETLKVLEEEIPLLAARGVRLVAPSELIAQQGGEVPRYTQLRFSPDLDLSARTPPPAGPGSTSAAAH